MPVSEARSNAARLNGAKSRGPVTPEGKARSAQNSRRHGMLSSDFVLRTENPEILQRYEEMYLEEWQPEGVTECGLVAEMALCRFRQSRTAAHETAIIDVQMDEDAPAIEQRFLQPPDNAVRTAIAFRNLADNSRALDLINRYETRYHRQYFRALRELKDLQDRRFGFGRYARKRGEPDPVAGLNRVMQPVAVPLEPPVAAAPAPTVVLPNEPETPPSALPQTAKLPNEPRASTETATASSPSQIQTPASAVEGAPKLPNEPKAPSGTAEANSAKKLDTSAAAAHAAKLPNEPSAPAETAYSDLPLERDGSPAAGDYIDKDDTAASSSLDDEPPAVPNVFYVVLSGGADL